MLDAVERRDEVDGDGLFEVGQIDFFERLGANGESSVL